VDIKCPDLELSLASLDIGDDATTTVSGIASSAHPCSSSTELASCSIFNHEDDDQYGMY
jgi:hypothetical protein